MGPRLARIVAVFGTILGGAAAHLACASFTDANDAVQPPVDASTTSDASLDAPAIDATSPDGATNGRFCDQVDATFCDDFESPPKVYDNWLTGFEVTDLEGALATAPHPKNGTNALRVTTGSTTQDASGRVTREFRKSSIGKVHLEADVFVEPATYDQRLVVLAVYYGDQSSAATRLAVELNVLGTGNATVTFSRATATTTLPSSRAFALGELQHVSLDVDALGTGTGTITWKIAGGNEATETVTRLPSVSPLRVLVGAHRYAPNNGGPAFTVFYDDVTITSP